MVSFYYHLKWKHYPLSQSTWEPETNMNDTAIVAKYYHDLALKNLDKPDRRHALARAIHRGIIDLCLNSDEE